MQKKDRWGCRRKIDRGAERYAKKSEDHRKKRLGCAVVKKEKDGNAKKKKWRAHHI